MDLSRPQGRATRSPSGVSKAMPDALDLLKTRRSYKARELSGPPPSAAEIDTLLTVASRVPDHGKLTPWRFIVFEGEARRAAGAAAMSLVLAANALGYGANWITEWYAYDRAVLDALGLKPHERIAGFVHTRRPPQPTEDRPRPPLNELATRFSD